MIGFLRTARPRPSVYDSVADASAAVVISGYSTSFGAACRLLAEPVRTHVRNVYALVRIADEIVDCVDFAQSGEQRRARLAALEHDVLDALATSHSSNLVVHAFARTAVRCGIDAGLVTPFFASMRMDLDLTVHDQASFERYVYGSAEVVGLMCLRVFLIDHAATATHAELEPGARALGAAFQKLNFLRDLADDHDDLGRSYFPGVDVASFGDADRDRLLRDIQVDLNAAAEVIPRLPASSRRAVRAAHALFEELSRRLAATPAAEICRSRVRVPNGVKARVLVGALVGPHA